MAAADEACERGVRGVRPGQGRRGQQSGLGGRRGRRKHRGPPHAAQRSVQAAVLLVRDWRDRPRREFLRAWAAEARRRARLGMAAVRAGAAVGAAERRAAWRIWRGVLRAAATRACAEQLQPLAAPCIRRRTAPARARRRCASPGREGLRTAPPPLLLCSSARPEKARHAAKKVT